MGMTGLILKTEAGDFVEVLCEPYVSMEVVFVLVRRGQAIVEIPAEELIFPTAEELRLRQYGTEQRKAFD